MVGDWNSIRELPLLADRWVPDSLLRNGCLGILFGAVTQYR